jgi:hypothetical protein
MNRDKLVLPLSLGNAVSGILKCSIRRNKLNPPGVIGKKGVLVNTPTLTWMYTRTFKERGKKIRYSIDISTVSSNKRDAVCLNKK